MDLINNINNKTITLWQTIIKAFSSIMPDDYGKVENNIAGNYDFIQLRPT